MISLVGLVVVLASVLGGFMVAGGSMPVLYQPAEFIVIGGAALGALLVGTPPSVLRGLAAQLPRFAGGGKTRRDYLDVLLLGFELLSLARREGLLAFEAHLADPAKSSIFGKHARLRADERAFVFLNDTLELFNSGLKLSDHELEALLDADIEVQHEEEARPARALMVMGDALPGLGIVAAVLGIVVTMGHIDGPPAEIGHHVGAALVGTFLGVLLSYGVVQPIASNLAAKVTSDGAYVRAVKALLLQLYRGANPTVAVELARRSLPVEVRPSAAELTQACKDLKSAPANA
jgi:chemotaxis protein MotA